MTYYLDLIYLSRFEFENRNHYAKFWVIISTIYPVFADCQICHVSRHLLRLYLLYGFNIKLVCLLISERKFSCVVVRGQQMQTCSLNCCRSSMVTPGTVTYQTAFEKTIQLFCQLHHHMCDIKSISCYFPIMIWNACLFLTRSLLKWNENVQSITHTAFVHFLRMQWHNHIITAKHPIFSLKRKFLVLLS